MPLQLYDLPFDESHQAESAALAMRRRLLNSTCTLCRKESLETTRWHRWNFAKPEKPQDMANYKL